MDLRRRFEASHDLADRLTGGAGFSDEEARTFLALAKPALLESYAWQADALQAIGLDSPMGARSLLSGVRAEALATHAGVSTQRAWDGLRTLVPALLSQRDRSSDTSAGGYHDASCP